MWCHHMSHKYTGQAACSAWRWAALLAASLSLWGGLQAAPESASPGDPVAGASATTQPAAAGPQTAPAGHVSAGATTRPAWAADPNQAGGEPDSIVQVANLIYAGTKSSRCFSDHFLVKAQKESAISTSRRFHAVKLDSDELFAFPLVIMTGEGAFELAESERRNLRTYLDRGGFLLASAGCSSQEWDRSFRQEVTRIFPEYALAPIDVEHPIFHTVYEIITLSAHHGTPRPLEGITIHGYLGILYSQEGLNDTAHAQGCCCCGGNEISNADEINVNILGYALAY